MTSSIIPAGRHYIKRSFAAVAVVALFGSLVGCGNDSYKSNNSSNQLTVNSPAAIVNESASNYDNNVNGLITYKTLKKWLDNWDANKPAGIKGKLVILQQGAGSTGIKFIKPDNKKVFTYVDSGWTENRNDGLMIINTMVLSGPSIDGFLKRYGIDVNNDLIVCAQGANNSSAYMNQGRCWYTLSYWGVDQKHIAVLNGNNKHLSDGAQLGASYFTDDTVDGVGPSPLINKQLSSVKDLKNDNFALFASIEDVINILPLTDAPDNGDGILLWDARNLPQYSAGNAKWDGSSVLATTPSLGSFQNNAPRQSHPRGALHLEFTNLIDTATGLYPSKSELLDIIKGGTGTQGHSFVSGENSYSPVGFGNAYQDGDIAYLYCETSMRAGIAIIATGVILGIPTRMYDGAMIQWNSLTSNIKDENGEVILPAGSPWDTVRLSSPFDVFGTDDLTKDGTSKAAPRSIAGWATEKGIDEDEVLATVPGTPLIVNPYAEHTNQVVDEDRAYKTPVVEDNNSNSGNNDNSGGNSGGGGALPTNPCGG